MWYSVASNSFVTNTSIIVKLTCNSVANEQQFFLSQTLPWHDHDISNAHHAITRHFVTKATHPY